MEQDHRALRRDASENRRRLLEAARRVFALHGIDAGVEEVAHEAGLGVGTLYRRFPTKDALIAELVRELLEETVARARVATEVPDGRGLEQFLYAVGAAQEENRGCLSRLWSDDTTVALRSEVRVLLDGLFADAQRHAVVRADATLSDVDLLFQSMRGIFAASADRPTSAWRRQVAISLAGLRPSAEPLSEPPVR
jgi:AcrR family transcriptional regulator